jgi:hypothetical protein
MRSQVEQFAASDLPNFDSAVKGAQAASSAIAGFTTEMGRLNQAASSASWGNQIRIANRSLGDALGMLGKVGATRLGQLQREQWVVSRASQHLGLQLQQREITTQLALAQFQAPGQTGEERYMRQKEEIIKAGIGQQQLGFSFKEFTISGSIWKENAERAATDARAAINVMQKARDAEGYAIAAQGAIAKQQMLLSTHMGKIDAIMAKAGGNWSDVLSTASSGIGQFGGALKDGIKEVYRALGYTVKEDKAGNVSISGTSLSGVGAAGAAGPKINTTTASDKKNRGASGLLGMTMGPTNFLAGEVKGEAVAILKNPQMSSLGASDGGGGISGGVHININGPVVRSEQDISSLARAVAGEVERVLSKKGQMLGLRAPAV